MKKKNFLLIIACLAAICGCDGNKGGGTSVKPADDPDASLWKMERYIPVDVKVYVGSDLVETYEIGIDAKNRVTSLVRKDVSRDLTLLDLAYSYSGATDLTIEGNYYFTSSARTLNATIDKDKSTLTYKGEWDKAWQYVTTFDENGTVELTKSELEFAPSTGQYSSTGNYYEAYTIADGNVTVARMGSEMVSQTSRITKSDASSELTIEYTYSDHPDNQNFGVFLMNCEFPVWLAKELPGTECLITGMTMKHGGVTLPESFTVEYTFDENDDIVTATRTDYNGKTEVLKRVYKLSY